MNKQWPKDVKDFSTKIFVNSNYKDFEYLGIHYLVTYYSEVYRSTFNKKKLYNATWKIWLLQLDIYLVAIIFSFFSFLYWLIKPKSKKRIGLWSGDFYSKENNADFRLGNLFNELNLKFSVIEFLRIKNTNRKRFYQNLWNRKRAVIYYDCFDPLFIPFTRKKKFKITLNEIHDKEIIEKYLQSRSRERYQFKLYKKIFKKIQLDFFIPWETSSRQIYMVAASKKNNIKTIGFMHGLSFNSYMSYEHLDFYDSPIGPDYFIVWSEFWKKYFEKNSKLYPNLLDWGTLRNDTQKTREKRLSNKILYICEPLIEHHYLIDYISALSDKYGERLVFKLRDDQCSFYNSLIRSHPKLKSHNIELRPFDKCIHDYSITVGSHSTAVVESSIYKIPFVAIYTKKWGDYFELFHEYPDFLAHSKEEMLVKVEKHLNIPNNTELNELSIKYFGGNRNCSDKIF